MAQTTRPFEPDWVVPPGAIIEEWLDERGMTQTSLASRLELSDKTMNQIIRGKAPLSQATAQHLETVTGVPASSWNALETNYREGLERLRQEAALAQHGEWLDGLPTAWLRKMGFVSATKHRKGLLVRQCLEFFGTATPAAWEGVWGAPQASYHRSESFDSVPGDLAAWLRAGEIAAEQIDAKAFSEEAARVAVAKVRARAAEPLAAVWPDIRADLAEAGIRLVLVPDPGGTRAAGATRWVGRRPIVQLSGRFGTDDQLWFALFHELGHVVLHGRAETFIESDFAAGDEKEAEASDFAAETLIPPTFDARLSGRSWSAAKVTELAEEIGVAPGILVGRLQFEGSIPRRHLNGLKAKVDVASLNSLADAA